MVELKSRVCHVHQSQTVRELRCEAGGGLHLAACRGLLNMLRSTVRAVACRRQTFREQGILAGAGLDVFPEEPRVNAGLIAHPRVVTLPHLGSATQETRRAMADLAVANVRAVLAGEKPLTPVLVPR